jgi:hypothetical protein
LLFRSARRTSAEEGPDKFCDAVFQDPRSGGLDLRISVYRLDAARAVACHAEHFAGNNLGPGGGLAYDLEGLAHQVQPDPLPASWPFAMTRQAHCEADFDSDEGVREMAALLHAAIAARSLNVSTGQLREYVRGEATNPEWSVYLRAASAEWRRLAGLPLQAS